ncbi:MAG: conjugal transfer protein TraK [Cellulophaga sp.]
MILVGETLKKILMLSQILWQIYNILKLNRFIVLAVVIGAVLTCIVSVVLVVKLHKETVNNAFVVNTDGSVIPLKLVLQQENLGVEALAHLELFHTHFYHIDASNYEKHLKKALWLGNSSIDALYRQKKADGVYNRLLQYSLVQRVLSINSKIDIQAKPYRFETKTIFEINRGSVTDIYKLITTGNLILVDRNFPKNTHGLLITNFFESTLKKIDHENRKK